MKSLLTTLSLLIFLFLGQPMLHAQTYKWVKGGGSNSSFAPPYISERIEHLCTDVNGNIYALGSLGNGAMVADTFHRSSAYGNNNNVFLASYTCSGQMRWAKLIGTANGARQFGLTVDNHGHIYIAGIFPHVGGDHTLYIGYDTAISTITYLAMGVMQFDTLGEFNWIRYLGANTTTSLGAFGNGANPLIMDGSDNVHFICNTQFGNPITPSVTSHYGAYDVSYDASGTLLSAVRLLQDTTIWVDGATLDKVSGKLYVHGTRSNIFRGAPYFMSYHPYIAAFDITRNLIWTDTLSNPVVSENAYFSGILTDGFGHIYINSGGGGKVVYHGDTAKNVLSTIPYQITSIMKMDTSGSLVWRRTYSANSDIAGFFSLTLMPNNRIGACGGMYGMIVGGMDTVTAYSGEGHNGYFTILDSAGYVHTIQQIHGAGFNDNAYAITADTKGSLYIGGAIESNVWGGSLSPYTSVGGETDFFIMKYGVDCNCTYLPVANYTVTGGATKVFTYTGTTASIDSVRWEFGDGGTSTALSPTHTYLSPGTFTACVTVYTACGSNTHCSDFTIICTGAPTASYTTSSGAGLTKTFTYSGTGLGSSGTLSWTFGDGTPAVAGTPAIHTFSAAGTYNVCVTATNPCGSNVSCTMITVTCVTPPVAAFTYSGSGVTRSFTYTGTTTGLDSLRWNFGDAGTATGSSPSHTYAATGVYHVCVIAYTNCGSSTICHDVTVNCITTVTASFTDTGNAVHGFTYTGTTSDLDSVVWDYGDSHSDTGITAHHTYAHSGTYHVCVTVYTNCGNNTYCHDVVVTPTSGIALLSQSDIKVFPNPATNELSITGIPGTTGYRIVAVTGICLQSGTLQSGTNTVTLPNIPAGIYILEMTGPTGDKNILRFIKG